MVMFGVATTNFFTRHISCRQTKKQSTIVFSRKNISFSFSLHSTLSTNFLFFSSFQSIFEGYFVNIRKCNYSCVEGYIIHTYINASNRIKFMIDHHCHLLEYVNGVCTHIRKKKKEEASFPSASRKEE